MAIIYSYPLNQPKRDDLLIGTITYDEDAVNPVHGNPTVSFTIGSLLNLVSGQGNIQDLQQVTNIGNTTTNSIIVSNSLKVSGGYYDSSNQPGTAGQLLSSTATGTQWVNTAQGVTSVGLSMPAAFTVTNSPITQAGTLTVAGAGIAAQYVNGLGNLTTFPTVDNYNKWQLRGANSDPTDPQSYINVTSELVLDILGGNYITTYSHAVNPIGVGNPAYLQINHNTTTRADTTSASTPAFGGTFEAVKNITTNTTGHVTAVDVATITIPAQIYQTTNITVSAAQLSALNGSPVTLLPAPGVGKTYHFNQIFFWLEVGSVVYNFGGMGPGGLGFISVTGLLGAPGGFSNLYDMDSASSSMVNQGKTFNIMNVDPATANTAVILTPFSTNPNPTQGNGILYVSISYQIKDLGPTIQAN